jgi:H+-transporting ATPase
MALVFGSESALYAVRERRRLWSSRPSVWVIVSSVCDILIIVVLVTRGIVMTPLPLPVVAWALAAAAAFGFVLDQAKVKVFRVLGIV